MQNREQCSKNWPKIQTLATFLQLFFIFLETYSWPLYMCTQLHSLLLYFIWKCLKHAVINVTASGEVQVYLWMLQCGNIVLLTVTLSDVAKFTTINTISLITSCKLSIPTAGLRTSSIPTFAPCSPSELIEYTV